MRMLIIGYSMGIRSERRLCEEVHLDLTYRWFCHLGLDGKVADHSSFSKNRHGRFRQSDSLRHMFKTVVERCLAHGSRERLPAQRNTSNPGHRRKKSSTQSTEASGKP
ncbi:transposase [Agrobacterium tumefaciens]|nr:transposase [Agrobacterium tumefaciens]